jgi:protein-tyrosine phosphatase
VQWVVPGRLARARRPGYAKAADGTKTVDRRQVPKWVERARREGIGGILCLLDDDELALYDGPEGGLLSYYRTHGLPVEHVPMEEHALPDAARMEAALAAYRRLPVPVLVHCSGGEGRTGAVVDFLRQRLPT